jgi:hypothetical protein
MKRRRGETHDPFGDDLIATFGRIDAKLDRLLAAIG